MKMKAMGLFEFGGPEVLKEITIEKPAPMEKEVLVKVLGTSLNYADIKTRKGAFFAASTVFPVVPGLDAFGTVEETGDKVKDFQKGDRVIVFPKSGSYQEYVKEDESLVFKVPDSVAFEQAVASPLVTFASYMMLESFAHVKEGDTIFVHSASGGMGNSITQIAKAMGAKKVIGLVGDKAKKETALKIGVDAVIIDKEEDFVKRIMEETDNEGVDVILDSLGGEYTKRGLEVLKNYGHLVAFGSTSGSFSEVDTSKLYATCKTVSGFSSVTIRNTKPEMFKEASRKIFKLMEDKKLILEISKIMDLPEAPTAHRLMEEGKVKGKIVLKV